MAIFPVVEFPQHREKEVAGNNGVVGTTTPIAFDFVFFLIELIGHADDDSKNADFNDDCLWRNRNVF